MSKALYKKENLGGKKSKVVSLRRKTGGFLSSSSEFQSPCVGHVRENGAHSAFCPKKDASNQFYNGECRCAERSHTVLLHVESTKQPPNGQNTSDAAK